jgi:hypothetical protein
MKSFKEYLTENAPWLTSKFGDYTFSIIDTNHALLRTIERESNHKELADKFTKGIFKFLNNNIKLHERGSPKFLFYSKILSRGIVMQVKNNKKNPNYKILIVVTVLPKKSAKETWPSKDETKVITENLVSENINDYLQEIDLESYNIEPYYIDNRIYDLTNMIAVEIV